MKKNKMKKIIFSLAIIAVVAVVNVNFNQKINSDGLSSLSLANVEALANNEAGTKVEYCHLDQLFSGD